MTSRFVSVGMWGILKILTIHNKGFVLVLYLYRGLYIYKMNCVLMCEVCELGVKCGMCVGCVCDVCEVCGVCVVFEVCEVCAKCV